MRLMTRFGVALMTALAVVALAQDDAPKWMQELQKDFENIEKARRNHAELHRGLVQKWQKAGQLDATIGEYKSRTASDADNAPLFYGLGYARAVRSNEGDLDAAVVALTQATKLDPTFALAYFSLGGVLFEQDKPDEALAAYRECVRLDESYAAAYYAMGEIYRFKSERQLALDNYGLALLWSEQEWTRPHYGKALIHYELENDADVEIELQTALDIDEKFAPAYFLLGQLRAVQGSTEEALRLYDVGEGHAGAVPPAELQNLARIFAYLEQSPEAEQFYRRAAAAMPEDGLIRFDLAETLWAQDRRDEAVVIYRRAIELDESLATTFVDQVEADFFTAEMSPADARNSLDKALAVNENDGDAHAIYAQVETAAGNFDAAIMHYEAAINIAPNRPDVYFPLGELYYAKNLRDQARDALRKAIELNPLQATKFADLGREAFDSERFDAAVVAWDKHLIVSPDDADARYWFARSLEATDDADRAIGQYERLRRTAPETQDALARLARLYVGQEKNAEALAALDDLTALRPTDADAHFTRATVLHEMGDSERAIAGFERVVELDATHVDAHEKLANLYEATDIDAAMASYRRVIELAPDRPGPYFRLGKLHFDRGEEEDVIDLYSKGVELQPRRGDEQYTLGGLLDDRNRLAEALPHYAMAVQVKPRQGGWQYDHARCAHRLGDAEAEPDAQTTLLTTANAAYSASIEIDPTADGHYWRGRMRFDHRQIGDALHLLSEIAADFQETVKLRPEYLDARFWLGKTYVDMEQDALARQTFGHLLERNASYPEANAELGGLSERDRNYAQAIDEYERELKVNADSARAHYRLGFLYASYRADPGTAAEHLDKATTLDPTNADAFVEYGRVLYQVDRLRGAADAFERALKLDPKNLTANFNLATVYEYLERPTLAMERWRYVLTLERLPGEWKLEAQSRLEQLQGR